MIIQARSSQTQELLAQESASCAPQHTPHQGADGSSSNSPTTLSPFEEEWRVISIRFGLSDGGVH
jgi:hypothetical protein